MPNCSRVFAYSIESSSARSAMPTQIGEITARSRSSPLMTTATPSFSLPTRFSAGTRQLSKTSSPVWLPRKPIFTSFCATLKPGKSRCTMKAEIPCAPRSGAVFAYTSRVSATGPLVM